MNKALFLDRDGTIIWDKHHQHKPEDIRPIPGVAEALGKARTAGYLLFLFTNQSGVGRGIFKMEDVHICNQRMLELLGLGDDLFADICIAPEHPEEPVVYRKPCPRFILEMMTKHALDPAQCSMVGDRVSDWGAGLGAGIAPIAVKTGKDFDEKASAFILDHDVAVYDDLVAYIEDLLL
ncbi:MAG: HAD-IIIA family hydrolase [Verrucomicrobiota bacterium]